MTRPESKGTIYSSIHISFCLLSVLVIYHDRIYPTQRGLSDNRKIDFEFKPRVDQSLGRAVSLNVFVIEI